MARGRGIGHEYDVTRSRCPQQAGRGSSALRGEGSHRPGGRVVADNKVRSDQYELSPRIHVDSLEGDLLPGGGIEQEGEPQLGGGRGQEEGAVGSEAQPGDAGPLRRQDIAQ